MPAEPKFKARKPVLEKTEVELDEFSPKPYPKIRVDSAWGNLGCVVLVIGLVATVATIVSFFMGLFFPVGAIGLLLIVLSIPIFLFVSNKEDELRRGIEATEEYKAQCRQIDFENEAEEARITKSNNDKIEQAAKGDQERYDKAVAAYEDAELKYEQDLQKFKDGPMRTWNDEYEELRSAIEATSSVLSGVYDQNILPIQYRNLAALTFLVAFLGTSRYQLDYAIERYDQQISIQTQKGIMDAVKAGNEIMRDVLAESKYQTYLAEVRTEIAKESNNTLKWINRVQGVDFGLREYRHFSEKMKKKYGFK